MSIKTLKISYAIFAELYVYKTLSSFFEQIFTVRTNLVNLKIANYAILSSRAQGFRPPIHYSNKVISYALIKIISRSNEIVEV